MHTETMEPCIRKPSKTYLKLVTVIDHLQKVLVKEWGGVTEDVKEH